MTVYICKNPNVHLNECILLNLHKDISIKLNNNNKKPLNLDGFSSPGNYCMLYNIPNWLYSSNPNLNTLIYFQQT